MARPRVVVLADDLIWGTRLAGYVEAAGAKSVPAHNLAQLQGILPSEPAMVIVDLTARAYDRLTAVRAAAAAGVQVYCLAQHDDEALRRTAREAGAERVLAYRVMAERGREIVEEWLRRLPTARPEIPAERYGERLARAAQLAGDARVDALLIGVGADLRYLAGYDAMPLERLTMLVVPASGAKPSLIAPLLEAPRASACPAAAANLVDLVTWQETDDVLAVAAGLVPGARAVAVSDRLWATFVLGLQAKLRKVRFSLASAVLRQMRIVKDADEIQLLRLAAAAADRVIDTVAAGPLVGRTEIDVSREIRERLVAEGHETAAFAIVGSGPNSASPHHDPGERVIAAGEPVVLDIGGALGGYGSDITRTVWVAGPEDVRPDDEFRRLYDTLHAAQAAATAAVRPGVPAEQIDAAARDPIAAAGYGEAFMHRTGHGIGLEEHEEPYIVSGNGEALRAGMAFSVEPGIYLQGRFGARIEDIVVCTDAGAEVLNHADRSLRIVSG